MTFFAFPSLPYYVLKILCLVVAAASRSRPIPFIPRDGTGRDGIGTGFSKWDGIVPSLLRAQQRWTARQNGPLIEGPDGPRPTPMLFSIHCLSLWTIIDAIVISASAFLLYSSSSFLPSLLIPPSFLSSFPPPFLFSFLPLFPLSHPETVLVILAIWIYTHFFLLFPPVYSHFHFLSFLSSSPLNCVLCY